MLCCQSWRSSAGHFIICSRSTIDTIARTHFSCKRIFFLRRPNSFLICPFELNFTVNDCRCNGTVRNNRFIDRFLQFYRMDFLWRCYGRFDCDALYKTELSKAIQGMRSTYRIAIKFAVNSKTQNQTIKIINEAFITQVSVVLNGKCIVSTKTKNSKIEKQKQITITIILVSARNTSASPKIEQCQKQDKKIRMKTFDQNHIAWFARVTELADVRVERTPTRWLYSQPKTKKKKTCAPKSNTLTERQDNIETNEIDHSQTHTHTVRNRT